MDTAETSPKAELEKCLQSLERACDAVGVPTTDVKSTRTHEDWCGALESWFSDTLAWLLDPCGDHGLKGSVGQKFLEHALSDRKANEATPSRPTRADFDKATVLRELHLNRVDEEKKTSNSRLLDLFYIVGTEAGIDWYVAVEIKLFGTAYEQQLAFYGDCLNKQRQPNIHIVRIVLTLDGHKPESPPDWIPLSWTEDISTILASIRGECDSATPHPALDSFHHRLRHLAELRNRDGMAGLGRALANAYAHLLRVALGQLGPGAEGAWTVENADGGASRLEHVASKKRLHVRVQKPFGLFVEVKQGKRAVGPKVFIPLGTHPSHVPNLVLNAAREIRERYGWKTDVELLRDAAQGQSSPIRLFDRPLLRLYQARHDLTLLQVI